MGGPLTDWSDEEQLKWGWQMTKKPPLKQHG